MMNALLMKSDQVIAILSSCLKIRAQSLSYSLHSFFILFAKPSISNDSTRLNALFITFCCSLSLDYLEVKEDNCLWMWIVTWNLNASGWKNAYFCRLNFRAVHYFLFKSQLSPLFGVRFFSVYFTIFTPCTCRTGHYSSFFSVCVCALVSLFFFFNFSFSMENSEFMQLDAHCSMFICCLCSNFVLK